MATTAQYNAYAEVLHRVNDVRLRATVNRVLDGLLASLALAALALAALTAAQAQARFGPAGRETLRVALLAALGVAALRLVLVVFRRQWSDERLARFVELQVPGASNNLINVIQLVRETGRWSNWLLDSAMVEAARKVRELDLSRAVSWRRVLWLGAAAALGLGLLAAFAAARPDEFSSALGQILHPYDFVPTRGALRLVVRPGDVELDRGSPLAVEVRCAEANRALPEARLFVMAPGERGERSLAMAATDDSAATWRYELPEVSAPLRYRVEVGRSQSDCYRVTVREKAVVARLALACAYPEYTGLAPRWEENATGHVRAPAGTRAALTVTTSGPVGRCTLRFAGGGDLACRAADPGGTAWQAAWQVLEDDTYRIDIGSGDSSAAGGLEYRVEALADQPPAVGLPLPGREASAPPGGRLKVFLKAADDYGFRSLKLFVHPETAPSAQPARLWEGQALAGRKTLVLPCEIAIPAEAKLGSAYQYYAEATDNLVFQGGPTPSQPHVVRSDAYRIRVEDVAAVARAQLREAEELYDRIRRLLESQREARGWLGSLAELSPGAAAARAGDVAARQKDIRTQTRSLVGQTRFDAETATVKATLELLAQNQMRQAELKSAALAEAARTGADRQMQHDLALTQNEIIVVLERLLDIAQAEVKAAQAALSEPGTDLPPDAREKLKNLADQLKEFIDQQRKVIEESQELAKKPVDDFTQEDKSKLAELAATEDRWEKFLAGAASDLSKLPGLDASNPTLARELVETQVDIEMARDALKRLAVEIAVPLEAAGVELAQEIVENLERWLPDTPDRIKWSMEEPPGPLEVPNAELPQELEDLVGDLLEQEEDLFDEMEDASSGWADSIDKGAGWDAMDGPISNFSAKGVTGNQLPNSSEISGRSGEGRTGKAAGEFVEDSASGKGGRRTPTRVTNDAFSQGEIKDTSKDPAGGATGGGKLSGAGGQGLEGPVPRQTERRMQRLAGRQAELRSQAEKINLDLKVGNFQNFNLDEALRSMRRVERELLAGRYGNALREKHVLLNQLKSTGMLLGGEIRVRTDARGDLPEGYRKEIEEAARAAMPEGFEELLKSYYQRLSQ